MKVIKQNLLNRSKMKSFCANSMFTRNVNTGLKVMDVHLPIQRNVLNSAVMEPTKNAAVIKIKNARFSIHLSAEVHSKIEYVTNKTASSTMLEALN